MGDGGPAAQAQFGHIQGIAVDRWGNLYLADTDSHRVRKVDFRGTIVTVAGTGAAGFSGDGHPAVQAQLSLPYGVAVDRNGVLYIADLGNNRVRRVGLDGNISTVAGSGLRGSALSGTVASEAPLLTPRNVAVDSAGNVYFSEFEGHRVRMISPDGRLFTVAGTGVAGFRGDGGIAAAAQLSYPAGLVFDAGGRLYIADSGNRRVRRVSTSGQIFTVAGGTEATALLAPTALAIGPDGTLFVADGSPVVRAQSAWAWTDFAGAGVPGFSGDGGPATAARLSNPRDLAASATALYIADGSRVRLVDAAGKIRTVAGDGYLRAIGDGGPAADALLYRPNSVALSAGALIIADTGTERVRRVGPGGAITTLAGTGEAGYSAEPATAASTSLNSPMGVAVDREGNVLVADANNHRIRRIGNDGHIETIAGTGAPGTSPEGASPLLTALRGPRGICLDAAGVMYIVDTANHRVLRVAPGGPVRTAAGSGAPGYGGDGGPARLARLRDPGACAVDAADRLYIADTGNHRVRRVRADGGLETVAGSGAGGFSGDGGNAMEAALFAPGGVAIDAQGNLFIADTGNHRIRRVTPAGIIGTIAGTGYPGFSGDDGPAAAAHLNAPAGLALDSSGVLYVADAVNNRVRRLTLEAGEPPSEPEPAPVIAVVTTAGVRTDALAPGQIVAITGSSLGPEAGVAGAYGPAGLLPIELAGVQARVNGVSAPLLFAQSSLVTAQVPYEIAGGGIARIEVCYKERPCAAAELPLAPSAPSLFTAILNHGGVLNSESSPAARGEIVTLYATGDGLTDGVNVSGQPATAPYAKPLAKASLTIGAITADILRAASAPGSVGLLQVEARVPGGFVPPGKALARLTVGGAVSNDIPIWLK